MNDLYTLTRKLVARGCEEHPNVGFFWHNGALVPGYLGPNEPMDVDDARDLWTMHALPWALEFAGHDFRDYLVGLFSDRVTSARKLLLGLLEAIEQETRHLEPVKS